MNSKVLYMKEVLNRDTHTILGVGPMSKIIVDVVIGLSKRVDAPICLIPSRRQIEAQSIGGGYVNNWTTEEFANYVKSQDSSHQVILSRDHSGPWGYGKMNKDGQVLTFEEAMNEVKESLRVDISAGFDLLHIDPSPAYEFGFNDEQVDTMIVDLIEFCEEFGKNNLAYEIGADEQDVAPVPVSLSKARLERILELLSRRQLPKPLFYVLQTGTKVMEMRNIGSFDSVIEVKGLLPASVQVPSSVKLCKEFGLSLKEHNADYLSDRALKWHRRFGIHAANVAPEFGVVQTKTLVETLERSGLGKALDEFQEVVLKGGKFEKWLVNNSLATEKEKVLMAGHYHFADTNLQSWFKEIDQHLSRKAISLDENIYNAVEASIVRYLEFFGYKVKNV